MVTRRKAFESVFPALCEKSLPTPQATPLIGTGSFGGSFGQSSQDSDQETPIDERLWQQVLEFLTLKETPITTEDAHHIEVLLSKWVEQPSPVVGRTINILMSSNLSYRTQNQDLYAWYLQEMSRHYLKFEIPLLLECLAGENPLSSTLQLLDAVQTVYISRIHRLQTGSKQHDVAHLQQSLHALFSTSLSQTSLNRLFKHEILRLARIHFKLGEDAQHSKPDEMQLDDVQDLTTSQVYVSRLLHKVQLVGLGGPQAEKVLAEAMSEIISEFVEKSYFQRWNSPSLVAEELDQWIRGAFAGFIAEALTCLADHAEDQSLKSILISQHDLEAWKTRAINELGLLRMKQLFDLIVNWDDSRGAIEDLRHYVLSVNGRSHITTQFAKELSRRLLQPGASTSQILDLYIRLIEVFAVLDPRGVLLDRVARPVRRYLRERDDTVKLIVGGLLSNTADEENSDPLSILAFKLEEATQLGAEDDDTEIDWDDMNWVPDPIDAEPEYRKSRSSDVIGNLISLFETRDVFVKEFQNILGERLLQTKHDFEAETRLLELLKIRFGEGPLQSCEVMLRDVFDSVRTDNWVKREQQMDPSLEVSTKILSRLFWPALHTETFRLPTPIEWVQSEYSAGFEKYKTSRKLTWLDALGEATVELEFEDRSIVEVVKTPHAALIYAFTGDDSSPIRKTPEELVKELEMDEDLVENGLFFWVGKLALTKNDDGSYSVLERLPAAAYQEHNPVEASKSSTLAAAAIASASAAAAATSALRSEEDVAKEKMQIYWQFIVGMLTNRGAMSLSSIVMMLNLAMAGGFPYSNEELRTFLGKRVDEGKLELAGGNYKIVKDAI